MATAIGFLAYLGLWLLLLNLNDQVEPGTPAFFVVLISCSAIGASIACFAQVLIDIRDTLKKATDGNQGS